jgi:hypothetical protein
MAIKRTPQIPAGAAESPVLGRAPRTDVVDSVAAHQEARPSVAEEVKPKPTAKKRTVTFTNRLDPDLLDWLDANKQKNGVTIAAALDEAVRDYRRKIDAGEETDLA